MRESRRKRARLRVARRLLSTVAMISPKRAAVQDAGGTIGPRLLFANHHRELEAACRTLPASASTESPLALGKRYRMFEHAVLEHLSAEETLVLPDFAARAPTGARAIQIHHAAIRKLLLQLGVEVELGAVRLETVANLIDALRAHAAHEDASMYPWSEVYLTLPAKRRLSLRLGRSLRLLAELQTRWLASTARTAES
jgi:hypothetical protein